MRDRRERRAWTWGVVAATALATIGVALAQDLVPEPEPKGHATREKARGKRKGAVLKGGGLVPGAPPAKRKQHAGVEPLGPPADVKGEVAAVKWPFRYRVSLNSFDG